MIAGVDVTFRYRVGWALAEYDSAVSLHEVREFRTLAGAETYQTELADLGRPALLQVGVLHWTTPEDAAERVSAAVSAGERLT